MKFNHKLILIVIATLGLVAAGRLSDPYFEIIKNLDIFTSLYQEVNTYYVDEVSPQDMVEKGIEGMLSELDPYTSYIAADQSQAFSIQTTGRYAGIGAQIGVVKNKLVVTGIISGFPAFEAGLKIGDELVSIDGQAVTIQSSFDASLLLLGRPNTNIDLVVKRTGQSDLYPITIVRKNITIPNVSYHGLIHPTIGYIRLEEFTPGASLEVTDILRKLKENGATSVVLDLRNNLGGSLYEAINVANAFLPKSKEIVSTKSNVADWNKSYATLNPSGDIDIPLIVLVNNSTASAAEIVAGALQDYDRAVLLGHRTFGKGLVQTTLALPYGAQLKVTSARYYIPSGRCIQALDYTHRDANDIPKIIADSGQEEFQTAGGRKVLDGGGIEPDILLPEKKYSELLRQLLGSGEIFEYANMFCNTKPMPDSIRAFRLSDADYDDFVNHTNRHELKLRPTLELMTEEVIASIENKAEYNTLIKPLNSLKDMIVEDHINDFYEHKEEIKYYLEQEIAFHHDPVHGKMEIILRHDEGIHQAKAILLDSQKYHQILQPF